MKRKLSYTETLMALSVFGLSLLLSPGNSLWAQDSVTSNAMVKAKAKPVKNTFQSIWIIDNQTVMVPIKGTFEMDIQHRFGVWKNGYQDFWGFFAPSNIRLGVNYAPINKLNLGIGVTKTTAGTIPNQAPSAISGPLWDGSAKYSIITQTKHRYPVSISYYANVAINTKKDTAHDIYRKENFIGIQTDRFSYFHQLIIARKMTEKLSVQIAPSISHQNVVNGYFVQLDSNTLKAKPNMKFDHFALAFSARYKLTEVTSVMLNYDQPITKHVSYNPNPSLSFGLEFNTSSHSFQLFFTNFYYLNPQINNLYNHNAPFSYTDVNNKKIEGGKFLIGFNITRLWNY